MTWFKFSRQCQLRNQSQSTWLYQKHFHIEREQQARGHWWTTLELRGIFRENRSWSDQPNFGTRCHQQSGRRKTSENSNAL